MIQSQVPQKKEVQLFNKKYILKKKISRGTFGVVFVGQDKETNEFYAIKLEKCEDNDGQPSFDREVQILQLLTGVKNVPQLKWNGTEYNYNVQVMDLLGRDLAYFVNINQKISVKSVVRIAVQSIKILEEIHTKSVVHRDLKPENIVIGREKQKNEIFLIDYGISKLYLDKYGRHLNFKENKPFIGTARYASIAAHKGVELSRKDDLESLGYVLIYLIRGNLPWQNIKDIDEDERIKVIGDMKCKITAEQLCSDIPIEFSRYLNYCRNLLYKQTPDYKHLTNIFEALVKQNNCLAKDYIWDWLDQKKTDSNIVENVNNKIKEHNAVQNKQKIEETQLKDNQNKNNMVGQHQNQNEQPSNLIVQSNEFLIESPKISNTNQNEQRMSSLIWSNLNITGGSNINLFGSSQNIMPQNNKLLQPSNRSDNSVNVSKLVYGKSDFNISYDQNYENENIMRFQEENVDDEQNFQGVIIEESKNDLSKSSEFNTLVNENTKKTNLTSAKSMSGYFVVMDEQLGSQTIEEKYQVLKSLQIQSHFKFIDHIQKNQKNIL